MDDVEQQEAHQAAADAGSTYLLWTGEINRHFRLAEPLRLTAQRRWWDILAFQLVIQLERDLREQLEQEEAERWQ